MRMPTIILSMFFVATSSFVHVTACTQSTSITMANAHASDESYSRVEAVVQSELGSASANAVKAGVGTVYYEAGKLDDDGAEVLSSSTSTLAFFNSDTLMRTALWDMPTVTHYGIYTIREHASLHYSQNANSTSGSGDDGGGSDVWIR